MARLPTRPGRLSVGSQPAPDASTTGHHQQPGHPSKDVEAQTAATAKEPKEIPPRRTEPTDILLCVLNPAPMFAYHSGNRRQVWPVVLAQFAALCLWVDATGARINVSTIAAIRESWTTFVVAPLKSAWSMLSALPTTGIAKASSKELHVLMAVVLHAFIIVAALSTYFEQNDQEVQQRASSEPRPVHPTDYVMLLVDDSALVAFHSPNRVAVAQKSILRALFVFSYLPQGVVYMVGGKGVEMTAFTWFMLVTHVGFSGFVVWNHQQSAGLTNDF